MQQRVGLNFIKLMTQPILNLIDSYMFKKRENKKRTFTVAELNDRNDDERLEKP